MRFRASEGVQLVDEPRRSGARSPQRASLYEAREKARSMGVDVAWDCEHAKTPDGYYQVRGGIDVRDRQVARGGAVRRHPLDGDQDRRPRTTPSVFADAIHAAVPRPDAGLQPVAVVQLGHHRHDRRRRCGAFPEELGKLGFVFNFITYGGHQIDGLAGEEFATALRQDGMLALARLQRKFRLLESPYRTPQTLVGGPRADAALMPLSGRTATTKAMGKGSTQFQHLVQTEVPPKLLEEWLDAVVQAPRRSRRALTRLAPAAHAPARELLELGI